MAARAPAARRSAPAARTGRVYRCRGCGSGVTLYVAAATVACSRCGRRMREERAR